VPVHTDLHRQLAIGGIQNGDKDQQQRPGGKGGVARVILKANWCGGKILLATRETDPVSVHHSASGKLLGKAVRFIRTSRNMGTDNGFAIFLRGSYEPENKEDTYDLQP
jgi:hypothetical protein